ncbi:RxLR effector protein [Phytophthora megakarya]|uniref:RxLR effector protein n=1 Tax=Phytophthora megakarya TaxID=4795 RepID=A0A225VHA4_9STRA|nr:RxLR effector protein [Phytophthora megakarya]
MRLQVWLLVVMLVVLFTSLSQAVDAGTIRSSTSKTVNSATAEENNVPERFLRGGDDITSGIEKPDYLANPDEEKALVLPKALQKLGYSTISAADSVLYNTVKIAADRPAAQKVRNFIIDRLLYPFYYSNGKRPKDLVEKANQQASPYAQEKIQSIADDFTKWIAKHHPDAN